MPMEAQARFTKIYDERVRSFLEMHYCKRVESRLPSVWLTRLHHMSNGNDVVLKGYPQRGLIQQFTNRILVHSEYI